MAADGGDVLAAGRRRCGWAAGCAAWAPLWLLRLAHYLRYRRTPDADEADAAGAGAAAGARWCWRRARCGAWRSGCSGAWASRTSWLALLLVVYTYCLGSVQLLATQWRVFLAFISLVLVPTILRVATDTSQPWHWQLAGLLTLLFGITVLMARTAGSALGAGDHAEGAHRGDWPRSCAWRRPRPRTRAAPPRPPAAPRRSSSPPPATTCASRCTRWACSPRRCASAPATPRWRRWSTASTSRSTRWKACSASCWTSRASTPAGSRSTRRRCAARAVRAGCACTSSRSRSRRGCSCSFRGGQHVAQADPVLLERILRNLVSNAHPLHRRRRRAGQLPAARRQAAAAGLGQRHRHLRGQPAAHLRGVLPGPGQPAAAGAPPQGPGPGPGDRQAADRPDGAPMDVRSRVGHGTVFSLELPLGKLPRADAASAAASEGAAGADAAGAAARWSSRTRRRCARAWSCCCRPGAPALPPSTPWPR